MDTIRERRSRATEPSGSVLSSFERRCLLRHIAECHELIQITILGAEDALGRAGANEGLHAICEALDVAEREIARAEQFAAQQADTSCENRELPVHAGRHRIGG